MFSAGIQRAGTEGQLNPKAMEIAQLPRFCYGQMKVPNAEGPEFGFPRDCGYGMNHYCPGLVHLIRAKTAIKLRDRGGELLEADGAVRYTERAIQEYPNCSIRGHINATRAEIDKLMAMYGVRRPKKRE